MNWKEGEMRGSMLFVQRKLSERYDFNNVRASKTASSVVEKNLMSIFNSIRLKFYMNYLILQK